MIRESRSERTSVCGSEKGEDVGNFKVRIKMCPTTF